MAGRSVLEIDINVLICTGGKGCIGNEVIVP